MTGELYADLWQSLPSSRRGRHVESLAAMKDVLQEELADGDVLLFKGSHSTRIRELVTWIRENGQRA